MVARNLARVESLRTGMTSDAVPAPGQGPVRPAWLRPEKKPPTADEIIQRATDERDAHATRLSRIEEMNVVLGVESPATYFRDRPGVRTGEIEKFPITAIRDEHDAMCSWLAQMDLRWEAFYVNLIDRDSAMAKESFLNLLWHDWQRMHAAQGYGPLRWALPDTISRMGMVAIWLAPDSTNECTGIDIRMLDPAQIFPVFDGKRGLSKVFRIFMAGPEQVLADYDDGSRGFKAKIDKIVSQNADEADHRFLGEVIEYWSREWAVITYQGVEIRKWRHGYYRVPMIVKYGCFGMQGFTATPRFQVREYPDGVARLGEVGTLDDRRLDLARQSCPFLYRRIEAQRNEERFGSRLSTLLRRSMNRPLVLKASPMTMRFGNPVVDTRDGGITKIGNEDALEPLDETPDAGIIQGLQSLFQMNRDTGMAKGMALGSTPGAQSSGTAMEIMTQGGFDRWAPVVMIEEEVLTEVGETALEIWMNHGGVLGPKKTRGRIAVPAAYPDPVTKVGKSYELDPKLLQETGTRVDAVLHKLNPSSLAGTTNAVVMLHERGLIDDRTAIELLHITNDPDRLIDTVKAKKIEMIPIIEQMDIMDMLTDQARAADARDDEEQMKKMLFRLEMLAQAMKMEWAIQQVKTLQAELALETGMIPPMGMEGEDPSSSGPPALEEGNPAMPQDPMQGDHLENEAAMEGVGVQGMPMPQMGGEVGTQGGRPPQG